MVLWSGGGVKNKNDRRLNTLELTHTAVNSNFFSFFNSVLQCKWCSGGQLDSGKQHMCFIQHDNSSNAEPKRAVLGVRNTHWWKQAEVFTFIKPRLYSQVSLLLSLVTLQRSSGLDETGPVVWHLALCLLLSSVIVGAVLIRGIKSSGKVSQHLRPPQVLWMLQAHGKISQMSCRVGFSAEFDLLKGVICINCWVSGCQVLTLSVCQVIRNTICVSSQPKAALGFNDKGIKLKI